MSPILQPDVSLYLVAAYAVLNPALIAVAFYLGRKANEKSKLLIASFAGAVAGVVLLDILALLGLFYAPTAGRAGAGIFAASLIPGLFYAWAGYQTKR